MSDPVKKWGHFRALPFAEVAGMLEEQDQALAKAGQQLKAGSAELAKATQVAVHCGEVIDQLLAEKRSLIGNLEDQTNATAAQKRRADELLAERAMLMALAQRIASASDPKLGEYAAAARGVLSTIKVNE